MLKIRDLSIKFGGIQALKDVSLEVAPKSFVGLMGPNGAGKTTVINCVSRVYDPDRGHIEFNGEDLLQLAGHQVLELGIARTFQDLNFFAKIEDMMIIDYLRLGQFHPRNNSFLRDGLGLGSSRRHDKALKARARRVLEFFREIREELEPSEKERGYPFLLGGEGFPDLIDVEFQPIGILSFAWRRRLDLARALVSNPKLLLLDEPAQGLPPSEIENLGRTLKRIQNELGVAALIVEHNIETLAKISDEMVVLSSGERISSGKPEQVVKAPEVIDLYLGRGHTGVEKPPGALSNKRHGQDVLLELKEVDLYYGIAQALFSVSLRVYPNEIVAILGTNGSGKSTLLKAISGVERPEFGEIIFRGQVVPPGWPEVAVEMGIQYVPQGHVIFPELTVYENLKVGLYAFERNTRSKIKRALEKAFFYFPDLKDKLNVQAANLSGGQQQMLAIAQAVVGNPAILLLDEPSLGLSPMMVDNLFHIIKKISDDEKCSIILVEQSVGKALEVSDHIYMLSSGVVVGEGSTQLFIESDEIVRKHLGFY
ncbi:MAG: ATP-binding cassette domain-containing protein [Bdellovibrionales bacterium]